MKGLLLVVLTVALAWTAYRLGEVERQRYALAIGICPSFATAGLGGDLSSYHNCIAEVAPRSSSVWNILYGLLGQVRQP